MEIVRQALLDRLAEALYVGLLLEGALRLALEVPLHDLVYFLPVQAVYQHVVLQRALSEVLHGRGQLRD